MVNRMEIKLRVKIVLVCVCIWVSIVSGVLALDDVSDFSCNGEIVSIGDDKAAVEHRCGRPSTMEQSGRVWIYNFGPTEFLYYLTFANDRLERIQTGDRGN